MKKKLISMLVLLIAAVTGAWAQDCYVVGTMTSWQKNDQYKMTLNASASDANEYQLGITLNANDEFKVIAVNGDDPWVWYPSEANYVVPADGLYTVYFRPGFNGGDDWHYKCIYLAEGAYLSATNGEWSLTMPSSDVELEVEYFTRATLTAEPAAAEPTEGTDAALLTAGTSEEGTLFYALSSQD